MWSASILVTTEMTGERNRKEASDSSASATRKSPLPSRALEPAAFRRPPMTKVGSMPPSARMLVTRLVVVVLPCVPAMAMPLFRRISSASIWARGTTGILRSRAATTSGLSALTAVDTTSASAPAMFSAAWPIMTLTPSPSRRRVVALAAISEPVTVKSRWASTSAMPLMPEPPTPTKWMCLTLCFIWHSLCNFRANGRHFCGGIGLGQAAGLFGHFQQLAAGIIADQGDGFRRQLGLRQQEGAAGMDQELGVPGLVVVDGMRERHQDAGHASRRQFGDGQRAGPADDQVGPFVGAGHVLDEGDAMRLDTDRGVVGLQRVEILLAGLMDDLRLVGFAELRHTLGHHFVQGLGAEAAADDEHVQRTATLGQPFSGGSNFCDLRADRIADPGAFAEHLREAGQDAVGDPGQHLVGQPGDRILLVQHQRHAGQRRHHAAREGDVAAHAEHDVRLDLANGLERLPETAQQI